MSNIALLKKMFQEVVVKKRANLQPAYYHKEFMLYANGLEQGYQQYIEEHEKIYKTNINYAFRFDDDAALECEDKAAMRVFITISHPDEPAKEIEVILIAQFKDKKLYRIWETTSPDWSKMDKFKNYEI